MNDHGEWAKTYASRLWLQPLSCCLQLAKIWPGLDDWCTGTSYTVITPYHSSRYSPKFYSVVINSVQWSNGSSLYFSRSRLQFDSRNGYVYHCTTTSQVQLTHSQDPLDVVRICLTNTIVKNPFFFLFFLSFQSCHKCCISSVDFGLQWLYLFGLSFMDLPYTYMAYRESDTLNTKHITYYCTVWIMNRSKH